MSMLTPKSKVVKPIIVVQGAQWGSEGKGQVAAALCTERNVDIAVRTGTINAGHTVYYNGKPYKMQQLPTSWAAVGCSRIGSGDSMMVIGPGAYTSPKVLAGEIRMVRDALGYAPTIHVDRRAGLHLESHQDRSAQANRHHKMGSTGKGCSEAVVDKISGRGSGSTLLFSDWCRSHRGAYPEFECIVFCDVPALLESAYSNGDQILVEGTQGSHLDIHLGPYPYTTHKQTQAAQWVQEAGLALGMQYEIIMVARTFPIRVAGNSGPMPRETDWPTLAREINGKLRLAGQPDRVDEAAITAWERAAALAGSKYGVPKHLALRQHLMTTEQRYIYKEGLSEINKEAFAGLEGKVQKELRKLFEFTTVTQKLRRVARWDPEMVRQAIRWNYPHRLVLSFWNYVQPTMWGMENWDHPDEIDWATLVAMAAEVGMDFDYITTGPSNEHFKHIGMAKASDAS